jgi:hypothetical protein
MKILKRTIFILMPMLLLVCIAAPADAQEADVVRRAQELHEAGVRLFLEEQYRDAAHMFTEAEQLSPNPLNLYNQARCYQELGEYETALDRIARYRAASGLTDEDRAGADQLRNEIIEAGRAASTSSIEPPQTLRQVPEQGPSDAGGVVESPPRAPLEDEPGGEPLSPSEVQEGRSLAAPWAVLGTGLGLLLIGGALDIVAFVRSDPASVEQFASHTEYADWHTETWSIAVGGDVLVGVGAALAVGGLIWLLVARNRRADRANRRAPLLSTSLERMTWQSGSGF